MQIGKYRLEGGGCCPEQWWVFDGELEVGYLRLRHGSFRAEHNGETVYRATPNGDGCFYDDEREAHLNAAVKAIDAARCPNAQAQALRPEQPKA